MNGSMTAARLRLILIVVIFLVIAAVAGGFLFAHRSLTGYAAQISQLNADADSGDQNIATLRTLENRLDMERATIESARSVVADNATFAERVVSDITRIAAQSGVTITSLEYVDSGTPSSGSSAAPAPTPTTPSAPGQATTTAPTGINKKSISVAVESPIDYTKLMTFIRNIEANRLKLQISTVSLTKEDGNKVGTQSFSIGAYVR